MAVVGPAGATPPAGLSGRHRRELEAAAVLMQLANLAGNRFLARAERPPRLQVGDARTARLFDLGMRALDRAGIAPARVRVAGRARGYVLEIGVGTGLNLAAYPADASLHGIDLSAPAIAIAGAAGRPDGTSRPPRDWGCRRVAIPGRLVRRDRRDLRAVLRG
jgi:hypothetical protein